MGKLIYPTVCIAFPSLMVCKLSPRYSAWAPSNAMLRPNYQCHAQVSKSMAVPSIHKAADHPNKEVLASVLIHMKSHEDFIEAW